MVLPLFLAAKSRSVVCYRDISCANPEKNRQGWAILTFFCTFLVINVFYRVLYGPFSRSNWSQWVQSLLEWGP